MTHTAMLLAAALAAGALDAVAGGGGLIMLPALLVFGPAVPVATLLGTNKLAAVAGTGTAAATYLRRTAVDWRILGPAAALAVLAAAGGASVAGTIPATAYRPVIIVALAAVALIVILRPKLGLRSRAHPGGTGRAITATLLAGAGIGLYDGLIGPGTGTFLLLTFTAVLGLDFLHASALAKVVNVGTNLGALVVFALGGHVLWLLGAAMAAANVLGARAGAALALRRGARFIRLVLLLVVGALLARLGWDQVHD